MSAMTVGAPGWVEASSAFRNPERAGFRIVQVSSSRAIETASLQFRSCGLIQLVREATQQVRDVML